MKVRIVGLKQLNAALEKIIDRSKDAEPAFKAIGIMQVRSTQKNFSVGGRPERWQKSLRVQMTGKKEGSGGGKTLVDKGIMKNSIIFLATRDKVKIGPSGPAAVYAIAHQLGLLIKIPEIRPRRAKALRFMGSDGQVHFARRVKAHTVRMPKREFLVFHDQDIKWAKRALLDYIMGMEA